MVANPDEYFKEGGALCRFTENGKNQKREAFSDWETIAKHKRSGSAWEQDSVSVFAPRQRRYDGAASATAQALHELETRWRPLRLEATDGGPAAWLLSAERANVAGFKARAAQWAEAVPAGGAELQKRQQALSDHVQNQVVGAVRAWDQTHAATEAAWQSHHQRVEETARAIAQEKPPPDSWLSEVRYREQARKHVSDQKSAEELLLAAADKLRGLETERAPWAANRRCPTESRQKGQRNC